MNVQHIEHAYAKINPYLAVTSRRADGYHAILSHMQAVTLCDTLTFTWHPTAGSRRYVSLRCDDPSLSCDGTNLVCRAAEALFALLDARGRSAYGMLEVQLEKRIPMAAGLGGGSADAAATLRGLNTLLGDPLTLDELCTLGATLGADIPFCVRCTSIPAMTARGIGELLSPCATLPGNCHLVIACHGEGVSTPWAYRCLDEQGVCSDGEAVEAAYTAFSDALKSGALSAVAAHSYNCFERVVLPARPAAVALIDDMKTDGAVFARMSGSGPSIVGYFGDEAVARQCAERLRAKEIAAYLCRPLG